VRRRKIRIVEVEDRETEIGDGEGLDGLQGELGGEGEVVDEGDGGREIGWFVSGRRGVVVIE
jgi:hypothetical protein